MNTAYCGKDCSNCSYKGELRCSGCVGENGEGAGARCRLAQCCLERGKVSCAACSSRENCDKINACENVPLVRLEQMKNEESGLEAARQESAFLGKWLWILFLLIIPFAISELMTLDLVASRLPQIGTAGQILQLASSVAYSIILIKLAGSSRKYKTAGICGLSSWIMLIIVDIAAKQLLQAELELIVMIPVTILSLIATYFEFSAHSQITGSVGSKLSGKWKSLWAWYIMLTLGLFFGSFILLFLDIFGILIFMGLTLGLLAAAIVKLVYLYETAKLFQNRAKAFCGDSETA